MDAACPPALQMIWVTTRVLELHGQVAAGKPEAVETVGALAALLEGSGHG